MINDERSRNDAIARALAALPRVRHPSSAFTDDVVRDLRRHGLVGAERARPPITRRWLVAAGLIFAAGIATGVRIEILISRGRTPAAARVATAGSSPVSTHNLPDVGHSEVWY